MAQFAAEAEWIFWVIQSQMGTTVTLWRAMSQDRDNETS